MEALKTQRMKENFNKKIQIHSINPNHIILWLKKGMSDLLKCPGLALFYGAIFWALSYGIWSFLSSQESMQDVAGPLLAVIILVLGPISAMSIYSASQKINNGENVSLGTLNKVIGAAFKTKGSCPSIFLSLILMILASAWMLFTPLIYAIFNADSLHIVSESQSVISSIVSNVVNLENTPFLITYGLFTAVLAWFAFMISWFSFPMVLDQDVDPFTAAVASLKASIANKLVMIIWIPIVGILVLVALMIPYFLGLIVIIPLLAHATWHAYTDLIGEMQEA